ncbi:ferredoxin [Oceanobacillus sp. E9]|uniref:ferredoxin n=1 Tax=Oceanobacillus sp. E9 TaxID=1742575 RepID=UPI00084E3F3D|nr:ferredoxin [Oceanobacillus sp. E9]OEH54090.1 ferredoxin [Oceanobacillus sp. E9]
MTAKYTKVNQETCLACGACGEVAPEIFDFDEEGVAYVFLDENKGICQIPDELVDDLEDAYEECPSESIKISSQPIISDESEDNS